LINFDDGSIQDKSPVVSLGLDHFSVFFFVVALAVIVVILIFVIIGVL